VKHRLGRIAMTWVFTACMRRAAAMGPHIAVAWIARGRLIHVGIPTDSMDALRHR
jgi:hypothetical protein